MPPFYPPPEQEPNGPPFPASPRPARLRRLSVSQSNSERGARMPWSSVKRCRFVPALAGIFLLMLSALPGWAASSPAAKPRLLGNFDVRVNGSAHALSAVVAGLPTVPLRPLPSAAQVKDQIKSMQKALKSLQTTSPGATARFSPVTAAPEIVSGNRGALTAAAPGRPGIDVVRDYLKANSALYGLTT